MNKKLSPKIDSVGPKELAETHQLGRLIWGFKWETCQQKRRLKFLCFFVLPLSFIFSLLLIGIPGVIISLYLIYNCIRRLTVGNVVFLYERGLVDKRQGKPIIIHHTQVQNIWQSVFRCKSEGIRHIFTINMQNGEQYKFDNKLENIEQFSYLLRDQIVCCQLPKIIASYNRGLPIQFGILSLNKDGLSQGKKLLSWSALRKIEICKGQILIRQKKQAYPWWKCWTGEIINLDLFLATVNYIQNAKKIS